MATSFSGGGVYRSKDHLKHFKIRIKIERCLSEYPSTPVIIKDENPNSLELQEFSCLDSLRTSKLEPVEDRVIGWQEKIFNDNEIKKYSNEAACETPLQKKYFRMLQNNDSNLRCRKILFTYVEEDEPIIDNTPLTKPVEYNTVLYKNVTECRNRKCGYLERETSNATNVVNSNPSHLQQKLNHCLSTPFQTMRIMAMIKNDLRSELIDNYIEVLLVTVTVDSKGVIIVTPDFNSGKKPYRVQIPGTRDFYYYKVEHASNRMNTDEKEREAKLELTSRTSRVINPPTHEFKMLDPNLLRLHIFGEIVSAEKFEYDGISVNFFLDLPEFWFAEDDQSLYHVTQTCKTKSTFDSDIAYFCYPFEYEVSCQVSTLAKEATGNLQKWPSINLQVISRDSWHRFRTEGYGYVNVPYAPGSYFFEINTWRPVVPTLSSQLRRLFIGGSPELTDLSQVVIPPTLNDKLLSRYGMRSETSGVVHLRLHVVQQCQSAQKDVVEVIEAFHRARQRILAARERIQL